MLGQDLNHCQPGLTGTRQPGKRNWLLAKLSLGKLVVHCGDVDNPCGSFF